MSNILVNANPPFVEIMGVQLTSGEVNDLINRLKWAEQVAREKKVPISAAPKNPKEEGG